MVQGNLVQNEVFTEEDWEITDDPPVLSIQNPGQYSTNSTKINFWIISSQYLRSSMFILHLLFTASIDVQSI